MLSERGMRIYKRHRKTYAANIALGLTKTRLEYDSLGYLEFTAKPKYHHPYVGLAYVTYKGHVLVIEIHDDDCAYADDDYFNYSEELKHFRKNYSRHQAWLKVQERKAEVAERKRPDYACGIVTYVFDHEDTTESSCWGYYYDDIDDLDWAILEHLNESIRLYEKEQQEAQAFACSC